MIKLARSWSAMQDILKKTYASLAELVYVFIILFLFMYIFALLGMEIFAYQCRFTPDLDGELVTDVAADYAADKPMSSPRENFDDTIAAVTTVFILTIGEDWPVVMYNYTRVYNHSQLIMLYFLITYSMGNFAMLSLFTAVLLSKFEEKDEEIEKEGEDEDKDDEEDDSKPKKPCLNKCVTFLRNFKLEYYRAFATEKLAQAIK
jgi:voltage-dependent calcium channel L type alpha-1D